MSKLFLDSSILLWLKYFPFAVYFFAFELLYKCRRIPNRYRKGCRLFLEGDMAVDKTDLFVFK